MLFFFHYIIFNSRNNIPANKNYSFLIKASSTLITLPIHSAELFDVCFLVAEIFLFCHLAMILLHYTLRLLAVVKEYQKQIIHSPNLELIQYDKIIQLFNIGTLVITNKVIRSLKITLFLIVCNPIVWNYNKFLLNGFFVSTPQIVLVKITLILLSIIILKTNLFYFRYDGVRTGDVSIILGYITFALLLFIQVYDFFILFILFETLALLFYIAIALRQITPNYHFISMQLQLSKYQKFAYYLGLSYPQSSYTILASFTYFLLNLFITGLFLFSLTCLLLIFQTTHFNQLIQYLFLFETISIPILNIGIIGILIVFLFKLSAAPFHWWVPAVFEGSPIVTLMFLAIPLKIAVFFLLTNILYGILYSLVFVWQPILIISAILCMLVGSIGLIQQVKLKRFWAYSTINHMGYLLLGLSTDSFLGLRATLIYLIAYILMNLGFFILTLSLTNAHIQQRVITLNQFALITKFKYTFLASIFSIILFSLIGIPPLLGFWGKYLILTSCLVALQTKYCLLIVLFIIITSLITTVCYLRIWKNIFIESPKFAIKFDIHPIPLYNLNLLTVICSLLIFLPVISIFFSTSIFQYIDLFLYYFF